MTTSKILVTAATGLTGQAAPGVCSVLLVNVQVIPSSPALAAVGKIGKTHTRRIEYI